MIKITLVLIILAHLVAAGAWLMEAINDSGRDR
jgi:hypothetical protein